MNTTIEDAGHGLPLGYSGRNALEVALEAAWSAGRIVMARFHKLRSFSYKGHRNPVTEVDLASEQRILALLRQEFPDHDVLAEEGHRPQGSSPYLWVIDPLDGTRNYASGIPHFCISIALMAQGEGLLGVIYDPLRKELFWAQQGKGAFAGDRPLSVSSQSSLSRAVIGFDLGYDDEQARWALQTALALWPDLQSFRVMGSAALGLAYLAAGRFDLYFHHFLYPWDLAAGWLLVTEAGGVITQRDGSPCTLHSRAVVVANAELHQEFFRRISSQP